MIKNVVAGFLLFSMGAGFCADIARKWKTIDDETKQEKSIVEIYQESSGEYSGKVIKIFPRPGKPSDPLCDLCEGELKGKPILGMKIISGIKKNSDGEFEGGTILDPSKGKVYRCKLKLEDKNLIVRGYLGFSLLGRSQTWLPYEGSE